MGSGAPSRDYSDRAAGAAPEAWATKISETNPDMWLRLADSGVAVGGTFADASGNGHDATLEALSGTVVQGAASLVPADSNASLDLRSGTARLAVTDTSFITSGGHTFAVAVKIDAPPTSVGSIISHGGLVNGTGRREFQSQVNSSGNLIVTWYKNDGTYLTWTTTYSICDGSTRLLVFVINPGGCVIYIDGVPVSDIQSREGQITATDPLTIAAMPAGDGRYLSAVFDEVIVWDRVMHAPEVADIYRCFTGV